MDSKFTPISLVSFKKILQENFNNFLDIKIWGEKTKPQTVKRDDNLPIALTFNLWPVLKVKFPDNFILNDEKILFRVNFGGKKYIGLLDQVNQISKEVTISAKIYRSEMRDEERLLCYPHRNVYLYTTCPKITSGNLLEFKSPNSPEIKKILEIRRKFIKRSDLLHEGDVIGMRVFDLNSTGVSVVTSREELDLLENQADQMNFKLNLIGETISLKTAQFVHSNHLILPDIRDSKLYKVGLKFDYNEEVFKMNEELIESSITFEQLERDLTKE